jgi:hypothetical protein
MWLYVVQLFSTSVEIIFFNSNGGLWPSFGCSSCGAGAMMIRASAQLTKWRRLQIPTALGTFAAYLNLRLSDQRET